MTVEPAANATRYRMLETVRAYATDRWEASGDRAQTTVALADWYLERFPLSERGNREWLAALALDLDTLGALLEAPELPASTTHALARIWAEPRTVADDLHVTIRQCDHVLETVPTPTPEKVRLVLLTAKLLGDTGDLAAALRRCDEGEAMLSDVGAADRWGPLRLVSPRPELLLRSEDPNDAAEAEVLARGDVDLATQASDRVNALLRLGLVLECRGRPAAAAVYDEAVRLGREIGDHVAVMVGLNNVVEVDLRDGALALAARHQREALGYASELGADHLVSFGLVAAARISEWLGDDRVAVRLHAYAEIRLDEVGRKLFPDDQLLSGEMLARTADRLGAERYATERAAGAALTVDQALAMADSVLRRAAS